MLFRSGREAVHLARLYTGAQMWQRAVGMAAINAISQFAFEAWGYPLPETAKTLGALDIAPDDHVGMVGYFPPLVDQIRALGARLTVVELNERWLQSAPRFEVTLDAERLEGCNKVISTGTVLINQTLDGLLARCRGASEFALVGPTVGCLPEPLFDRGVTVLGGTRVVDTAEFKRRWAAQEKWRAATRRYVLRAEERVVGGESVIIGKAGKPVAVLSPYVAPRTPRRPGSMKGRIRIADDCDADADHLADRFEAGTKDD